MAVESNIIAPAPSPVRILVGDCRAGLRTLPDESVHCVVTSPPYWGLRDYGVDGQIGLERTIDGYVSTLVEVMREVRRVLRNDGTLWLNLGDCYSNIGKTGGRSGGKHARGLHGGHQTSSRAHGGRIDGLKPKDLVGVPWRVAFALQADGWFLRRDIVWEKVNAMPESVLDRPSTSHEYIFLLSKRARYFYDADAVRTPDRGGDHRRNVLDPSASHVPGTSDHSGIRRAEGRNGAGANLRSVWSIASRPYPGAHFATWPPALVEPCIRAGMSAKGCCPACGAQYVRIREKSGTTTSGGTNRRIASIRDQQGKNGAFVTGRWATYATAGWRPSCRCDAGEPVPCTVLDPFGGTAVTAAVAVTHGHHAILCELNADYVPLQRDRLGLFVPTVTHVGAWTGGS